MWKEHLPSMSIEYKLETDSTGTYTGTGERVFIETPDGPLSQLPYIGSAFYDSATSTIYDGINLQSIKIQHTHKLNGSGRTATCFYNDKEEQKPKEEIDVYGDYTGQVKLVKQDGKNSNWAYYEGDYSGVDANFTNDWARSYGLVSNALQWLIPSGVVRRRYIMTDNAFNEFKTVDFPAAAGKLNNDELFGFKVGCVLLTTYDANKKYIDGVEKWEVYCNYEWKIINNTKMLGVDSHQFVPSPLDYKVWTRPVFVQRSGGSSPVSNISLLYEYTDLTSLDAAYS